MNYYEKNFRTRRINLTLVFFIYSEREIQKIILGGYRNESSEIRNSNRPGFNKRK